jgi:hypothetical protein
MIGVQCDTVRAHARARVRIMMRIGNSGRSTASLLADTGWRAAAFLAPRCPHCVHVSRLGTRAVSASKPKPHSLTHFPPPPPHLIPSWACTLSLSPPYVHSQIRRVDVVDVGGKPGAVDFSMLDALDKFLEVHVGQPPSLKATSLVVLLTADADFSAKVAQVTRAGFDVVLVNNGNMNPALSGIVQGHSPRWRSILDRCRGAAGGAGAGAGAGSGGASVGPGVLTVLDVPPEDPSVLHRERLSRSKFYFLRRCVHVCSCLQKWR